VFSEIFLCLRKESSKFASEETKETWFTKMSEISRGFLMSESLDFS